MKIVIIGAKGMLGQELAKTFAGSNPILWDRENVDIANEKNVQKMIGETRPDLVINAAAFNDVDGAEKNRQIANDINGYAIGYLARAITAVQGILVHYSTDYVFKGDVKNGYNEEDKPNPQSVYASSKFLGEIELQNNCHNFYLIRLSRLFGQPAGSQTGKKSFVQLMLDLAKANKEINVVNEELSRPTYAPDLAAQTKFIFDSKKPFGIYHVTNASACTWFDFAREIFAQKSISAKINPVTADFYPRPVKRPKYSILLNNKLPALRSWQEALADYLKNANEIQ
ncbi:MAG: dTDP-4-dehydrorhamnose reductase [Patescibacteria group bacterium]|jgi:dTDP-4-dehydrorhamnose reductase